MTTQTPITSFKGEFGFLSNFYPHMIVLNGLQYATVEHAYQAMKTQDLNEREFVRCAQTPAKAKSLGRKVTIRPDWEEIKDAVMLYCLQRKFQTDSPLRVQLLSTGDRELIENNTWGDTYWGVCKGQGQNMLGQLLMQVRREVRKTTWGVYYMKYIVLEVTSEKVGIMEVPFMFPDLMVHSQVSLAMQRLLYDMYKPCVVQPISAGFFSSFEFDSRKCCYGESESLKLKSRGIIDSSLLSGCDYGSWLKG